MTFEKARNQQAFAKIGILGRQGSGKTFLAKNLAIGIHQLSVKKKITQPKTPVFFLDTETGSDWVKPFFDESKIELSVDKTRAFTRLVPAIREVAKVHGILILDSVTHFWKELTTSYAKKKRRNSLAFSDWAWLKQQWSEFTDEFVNSQCHIIMCGRAGFEYDFFEDETGKKELIKTGIKMKAEGETGYEPSLLVLMERFQELDKNQVTNVYRTAHVLKDRGNVIDGKIFKNPSFENFAPHIACLNIGGEHVGVDTTTTSEGIVPEDDRNWAKEKREKEVLLDEIQCHLVMLHPSTAVKDKKAKADLLEEFFGTRSWKRVETIKLADLRMFYGNLVNKDANKDTKEQVAESF